MTLGAFIKPLTRIQRHGESFLDTFVHFSDWVGSFMPKIVEDDAFSTVMFSFDIKDDFKFYVVVF